MTGTRSTSPAKSQMNGHGSALEVPRLYCIHLQMIKLDLEAVKLFQIIVSAQIKWVLRTSFSSPRQDLSHAMPNE